MRVAPAKPRPIAASAIAASAPRTMKSARVTGWRPSRGSEVAVVILCVLAAPGCPVSRGTGYSLDVIDHVRTPRRQLIADFDRVRTQRHRFRHAAAVAMMQFRQQVARAYLVTDPD